MLRILALAGILLLLVLRMFRSSFGARFLGVSEKVIDWVYIVALVIACAAAIWTEYWLLLVVAGVLLVVRGIEEIRARRGAREGSAGR